MKVLFLLWHIAPDEGRILKELALFLSPRYPFTRRVRMYGPSEEDLIELLFAELTGQGGCGIVVVSIGSASEIKKGECRYYTCEVSYWNWFSFEGL
jgi:hypothetical protein